MLSDCPLEYFIDWYQKAEWGLKNSSSLKLINFKIIFFSKWFAFILKKQKNNSFVQIKTLSLTEQNFW